MYGEEKRQRPRSKMGMTQEGSRMETVFTPWMSLAGGVLIGISATLLMAMNGRIAGMTGIMTGIIPPFSTDWPWRVAFLAGAVIAPVIYLAAGGAIPYAVPVALPLLALGGLIVGVGVYFGAGCTSGHGVCGMARLSPRSIAATVTFMIFTGLTVYVVRHVAGL
ncbi:MAG: YeeE/YedE family protein [Hoeflea sp.]|uniref:YeeE/YedE family protein n=1 Tax=Hoeflea sp. TaxID=1940281 RepID=UPI00273168CA|nr:YeeE/YedE family protein [Hoeflea sp.]MDP2120404.1 YeeE/YedE family protein [Hoeflea sp.]MDZ7602377.1 YeeE/YedE family protein [Hoeflea sp.]